MLKNLIIYILVFTMVYFLGYFAHDWYVIDNEIRLVYTLQSVYLFHAIGSFVICAVFYILSNNSKLLQQLGFIYLGTLVLKIVIFSIVFKDSILAVEELSKTDSASLLVPMGLFLIVEVYFVAKILNKK